MEENHIFSKVKQDRPFGLRIIKPRVNIRNGPGKSYQRVASAKENEILPGLGKEGEWYLCRMPNGKEGWVVEWACKPVPFHHEKASSEQRQAVASSDGALVMAGPAEVYPVLEVLSMGTSMGVYLEEDGWLYIKTANGEVEGWVSGDSVHDPKKDIDTNALKDEAFNISQKLSRYYDKEKMGIDAYRDAGWYPSFMILQGEKDIQIEPLSNGWRLKLTFSLRNISMDTLFPLSMETVSSSLSRSDRLFFMVLVQAIMENEAFEEIEIIIRGIKRSKGAPSMKWVSTGGIVVNRTVLSGMDLDKTDPDEFWKKLSKERPPDTSSSLDIIL